MPAKILRSATALLAVLICASGCQTRRPVEPTTAEKVPAGAPIVFHPAVAQVPINMESGRYPTLFAGGTRATWIEAGSMAADAMTPAAPANAQGTTPKASVDAMNREDAAVMSDAIVVAPKPEMSSMADDVRMYSAGFNVVVVDAESAFTDTSIAYDVVGFRGIHAYLQLPNGAQLTPVQIIVGSDLEQQAMGALRKYHRRNLLLFPKEPISVATPMAGTQAPGLRLVLEGNGCLFYFEWPALLPGMIGPPKFTEREGVKKIEAGYEVGRKKERGILHKFD